MAWLAKIAFLHARTRFVTATLTQWLLGREQAQKPKPGCCQVESRKKRSFSSLFRFDELLLKTGGGVCFQARVELAPAPHHECGQAGGETNHEEAEVGVRDDPRV